MEQCWCYKHTNLTLNENWYLLLWYSRPCKDTSQCMQHQFRHILPSSCCYRCTHSFRKQDSMLCDRYKASCRGNVRDKQPSRLCILPRSCCCTSPHWFHRYMKCDEDTRSDLKKQEGSPLTSGYWNKAETKRGECVKGLHTKFKEDLRRATYYSCGCGGHRQKQQSMLRVSLRCRLLYAASWAKLDKKLEAMITAENEWIAKRSKRVLARNFWHERMDDNESEDCTMDAASFK